jgi:KaiC/GvpD/RAD55 family RecA-like ATPase
MTWNRFKDLLAVKLNIAVKNLDDAPDAEPYYTIWEQCEAQYIKEKQSDEYFDKWKAELKWMVDFYVKNKSKWLCKRKYLMLKQECFGTICERPCEAKKECAKCRKLQDVSPYSFITEWSQEREDELHQISSETKGRREISYGENVEERIDKYRQERAFRLAGNKTLGITTGLESFDEITDGFRKAQVVGFFGRSGVGKSALVLQMMLDAWVNSNTNILFWNLELPIWEIQKRMDSCLTGVAFNKLYTGKWESDKEYNDFEVRLNNLYKNKQNQFKVLDVFDLNLTSMHQILKKYYQLWGDNFIVALDNISRMSAPLGMKEFEWYKKVAIAFHKGMKEFNCSGVLVGQLNRDGKNVKRVGEADGNVIAGADAIINDLTAAFLLQKYLGQEQIKAIPLKGRNFAMKECIMLKNNLWRMRMEEMEVVGNTYDSDISEFTVDDEGQDLGF